MISSSWEIPLLCSQGGRIPIDLGVWSSLCTSEHLPKYSSAVPLFPWGMGSVSQEIHSCWIFS